MSVKRKSFVLSSEEKLFAIKHLDWSETLKEVATDIGVSEVAVGGWRHERGQSENSVFQHTQSSGDKINGKKEATNEK